MKHTVSFFKRRIKEINDGLEKENYIQRLRAQYLMEKGQLKNVAFYYRSVHRFGVLSPEQIITEGLIAKQAENWLDKFDPQAFGFEIAQEDKFVNGFHSWHAVHFEVSKNTDFKQVGTQAYFRFLVEGMCGVYELAREMTDQFEREHKGKCCDSHLSRLVEAYCLKHCI